MTARIVTPPNHHSAFVTTPETSVWLLTESPAGDRYRWLSPPPAFQKLRRRLCTCG